MDRSQGDEASRKPCRCWTAAVIAAVSMVAGCGGGQGAPDGDKAAAATTPEATAAAPSPTTPQAPKAAPDSVPSPQVDAAQSGALTALQTEAAAFTAAQAQATAPTTPAVATPANAPPSSTADSTPGVITPVTPALAPAPAPATLRWSDPRSWGGTLPAAGDDVVVPAGKTIVLDTATPALGMLRIQGTLQFDDKDVAITAAGIDVTGALRAGSASAPYVHKAVITLNGAPAAGNDGVSRGINVRGGTLALHGLAPAPVWTRLNDHANAGAQSLTLAEAVDWRSGSLLAIAPTDYYGVAQTERIGLAGASGTRAQLAAPLAKFRWGRMQYMTAQGMSLTPDPGYAPPVAPAPTELDERATVANLSRNIVVQGADDAAWRASGFGAHLMVMDLRSKVVIDGVEFRRAGQAGVTGRYPIHWHMLSYAADGSPLGDAAGHVVRNSAVWDSANRCVVIHGTNGVLVKDNVCQDIKGHAFFLEDAVERRNVFEGNLALTMRAPAADRLLMVHEGPGVYQAGPSGFWITNPDNVLRHNVGGDAQGNGFWLSFPPKPLGLSAAVPILPNRLKHGVFEFNTAHTSRGPGVLMNWVPVDALGNVSPVKYIPTADGKSDTGANRVRLQLKRVTSYKNLDGAYKNVVSAPDYLEWVTADNVGVHFSGSVDDGVITRGLAVAASLNNLTPYPNIWPWEKPSAYATYHSTLAQRDNTIVGFAFVPGKTSGAFKTNDYYIRAVEKGTARNANNRLVDSHPGYRELPPAMENLGAPNRHWTYAGAIWDPHGYWGPQGGYWVYDTPFLTAGANCAWAAPAGQNGKLCDGEYYGVGGYQTDFDTGRYAFLAPIDVARLDASLQEIGRWMVGDGATSTMLGNMRHFAARPGGVYKVSFPGKPLPQRFEADIENAFRLGDSFVLGVSFDGTVPATGYTISGDVHNRARYKGLAPGAAWPANARPFTPVGSLVQVLQSNGHTLWQDTANNIVWLKYRGDLPLPAGFAFGQPNSDPDLYRAQSVVLYAK